MANEAVIVELHGSPSGESVRYTCLDAVGIEKGALLALEDPKTLSGANTNFKAFGGIASAEKVASDGSTSLAVWTNGIFDLVCSQATTHAGQLLALSGANTLRLATAADILSGAVVGKALEIATAEEVIQVLVGDYL